jgi:hypothetical protein
MTDLVEAPLCLDCGTPLTGHFCSACGQRADPAHKSLRDFAAEFTEGLTNFDAKLWRTLPALVTRPGFLTAEFNAGRRTRYVHPFRVYLFVTFVFFGLFAVFGKGTSVLELDATPSPQGTVAPMERVLIEAAEKLHAAGDHQVADQFAQHLPQVMFMVLPVAALLLKVAYGRRRFYIEHLVFVTHVHSFVFLVLSLFVALPISGRVSGPIPTLAALVYFVLALKRTYGETVGITLAKASVLAFGYTILLVVGLMVTEALVVLAL